MARRSGKRKGREEKKDEEKSGRVKKNQEASRTRKKGSSHKSAMVATETSETKKNVAKGKALTSSRLPVVQTKRILSSSLTNRDTGNVQALGQF